MVKVRTRSFFFFFLLLKSWKVTCHIYTYSERREHPNKTQSYGIYSMRLIPFLFL